MIRVLFAYEYLTYGGVETVIRTRLHQLSKYGIEAWAWFRKPGSGVQLFTEFEDRVFVGKTPRISNMLRNGFFDLVSVFDPGDILSLLERGQRLVVVECHSPYIENLDYLRSLRPGQVEVILVPSSHQRHVVEDRLTESIPIMVVPNALSAEFSKPLIPFRPRPPRPVIAWIGRLDSLKNWKAFLELASRVVSNGQDVEVWMVGSFPPNSGSQDLYQLAKRLDLLGRLRWFQNLPHERMPRLLDAVRDSGGVLICTSLGESFGMAVAEAMARAVAVVVPQRPPFDEFVIHNVSGMMSGTVNADEMSELVTVLLTDKEAREKLGSNARMGVLERFSVDKALPVLCGLLKGLVSARSKAE